VDRSVPITVDGLDGDAVCDTRHHGGVDQAVYVYGLPDYEWWASALGRQLAPGTLGENLTITELESSRIRVGDRFHIRNVVLEVTAPRIPCGTLARRMKDNFFAEHFRRAERPGFYCRVIKAGEVEAGDTVDFKPYAAETITIIEMFRAFYSPDLDEPTLRSHLAAPIDIRTRVEKEAQLSKLLQPNLRLHP
jgi:MOSC domain-containing protein YiiM